MITDLDLANLCQRLYNTLDGWDVLWGQDEWGLTAALHVWGDRDVVIHRGSTTVLDWFDDARSELPCEPPDPALGEVPAGFFAPLRAWSAKSFGLIRPGPIIIGHSLGAARAVEHAGLLAAVGKPPVAVVVWGCPRPGTSVLANVLSSLPVRWYRNRQDPVCDVPVTIPLLLSWEHVGVEIKFDEAPPADDPWGPLADHHFELYQAGTAKRAG